MVYVLDEGSEFNASLAKIWEFNQKHAEHPHQSMMNLSMEPAGENAFILSWENEMQGRRIRNKAKNTVYPPFGTILEFLEGPFAGSKAFQYYVPKGNKTGVTVVGDWKCPPMSDDQVKQVVLTFLDQAFNEDQAALAKMK